MATLYDTRRYLTDFDSRRVGHIVTDVLVIGSGVAGARAALAAAERVPVTLLCKRSFRDSATRYAQGGIAAAMSADDSADAHFQDTMRVGCGLNTADAVRLLVEQGPKRIQELLTWGFLLDHAGPGIALGREAGHSKSRIVHAGGDRTGSALVDVLAPRIWENDAIRVFENCFLLDLLLERDRCVGVVTFHPEHGHQLIWAKQTILASGGCGQIWRETTNPAVSTGDGIAAAFRAGAHLRDMEMMQFHPTTLYVAGAGRALISEAVRGEGACLVDRNGERFMRSYHPDGELAPRDVVSRAIHEHLHNSHANCVFLDVRHLSRFHDRFPQVARLCSDFQIDVRRDLIPVRPSAHYMIGGVAVDLDGQSSVKGLLCCGEASSTGVHGANRLASNSLLEGLVFGTRTGARAAELASKEPEEPGVHSFVNRNDPSTRTELDLSDIRNSLHSVMWRNAGIVRSGERLQETCDILDFWGHYTLDKTFDDVVGWELQNQLTVARMVANSALARTESIGVHFRSDGVTGTTGPPRHTWIVRNESGTVAVGVPDAGTPSRCPAG